VGIWIGSTVTASSYTANGAYDDPAFSYPAASGQALYVGPVPPPAGRQGAFVRQFNADPQRYFTGLWRKPLAADAPLEDRAAYNGTSDVTFNRAGTTYATRFAHQAAYSDASTPVAGYYAAHYQTTIGHGAPLYIIPTRNHPRQKVTWLTANGTGPPANDTQTAGLQARFQSVPVPVGLNGARFETTYARELHGPGTDQHLAIYDPFTHEMWECWIFNWDAQHGYTMGYGAYTADVRTAPEAYPDLWGARATSLPLIAGMMLQEEYAEAVANSDPRAFRHPLAFAVPVVEGVGAVGTATKFIPPATRGDGVSVAMVVNGDSRDAVPEGLWLRLPANYVIDSTKPLLWQAVRYAARDYGIVVVDSTGGNMGPQVNSGNAIGTPYSPLAVESLPHPDTDGGSNLLWGVNNVLNDFPWASLQQVKYVAPVGG
jgi:hypothetical protein